MAAVQPAGPEPMMTRLWMASAEESDIAAARIRKCFVGGKTTAGAWPAVFAGLAILLLAFGLNLLGDALRDTLDPRLRGQP